eukprot:13238393-Ditylum_brightwellii.AAC.1
MAHPSIKEITKNFSQQVIPKMTGRPTYMGIHAVHHLLMKNAASMLTMLDSSKYSHLTLVTNLIKCLAISRGVAFLLLHNLVPAPLPPHLFMIATEMEMFKI